MAERVATRFLIAAIAFMVGALTLVKAFEILIQAGFSVAWAVKFAIYLAVFLPACFVLNKYNYFNDKIQQQRLIRLQMGFRQVLAALATLLGLVGLRPVLFGSR